MFRVGLEKDVYLYYMKTFLPEYNVYSKIQKAQIKNISKKREKL